MWICRVMKVLLPLTLLAVALCGCANRTTEDGYVNVIGGKVYYKMIGGGGGTPLLVVHGGPCVPHQYLQSLSEIAAIREELGLHEVYILADSWGAIPATEYLLTMPKGVRGVVLSSPILSG